MQAQGGFGRSRRTTAVSDGAFAQQQNQPGFHIKMFIIYFKNYNYMCS